MSKKRTYRMSEKINKDDISKRDEEANPMLLMKKMVCFSFKKICFLFLFKKHKYSFCITDNLVIPKTDHCK